MKSFISLIFGIAAIIIGTTPVIFAPYLGVALGGIGIFTYVKREDDDNFAKAGIVTSIIGISLSANLIWNYFANEMLYDLFDENFLDLIGLF